MGRRCACSMLLLAALAACSAAPVSSLPALACTTPGSVQALKIESVGQVGLYLPPCYDSQAEYLYPVLYLLPGAGGAPDTWLDAGLAPLLDGLILDGEIPPLIVLTPDDTLEDLAPDLIVEALIPYVESHLRARPERSWRAIAGGSLGGASAYFLAFQHPDLFASAGVFGNGLVTGMDSEIAAWLEVIPEESRPRLFLNSGEQDAYMLRQARALIPLLDRYGIEHAEIFSPGGHDYRYWLSNFPSYLRWLAEDWE